MSQPNQQLFGRKTVEKFCSKIKVTAKQKKAAKDWLELLHQDKLRDEKKNYLKFSRIVLEEILGYPVKDIDHESGNVEFQYADSSGKNVLCIEAKGTSTKDLFALQHRTKKEHATPIKQTWDYMGKLNLEYGICTNYKDFVLITKIRGYSKYYFFDFTKAKDEDKLKEFLGIFSKSRIIDEGFVEKLYDESVTEEKEFTKEFYKLYHETRLILIRAFSEKENVSQEDAIHYSQLFLNRLIFMFFVSDSGDVPRRLFTEQMHKVLNSDLVNDHSRLAFDQIMNLFKMMDRGSHDPKMFGYNGGLFAEEIPHKVYFKDLQNPELFADIQKNSKLKKSVKLDEYSEKIVKKYGSRLNPLISNLLIMDSFDFTTDVNVNILGHIFEQSISDLEALSGQETSKRKKDGVYYTPEYITDYICRNTIIPYLSKSGEITDPQELVAEYSDDIENLEKRFREIKILDPACGSGAFLVKAVDILLEINKAIQDYKQSLGKYSTGDQFSLTKWNEETEIRAIIENNIYGVDINEESVEITKLALFLKIASSNRKLLSLSQNIKVGNSLIDNKRVDSKAFDWKKEFPEILDPLIENPGFDVVIGNPPYIRQELFKEIKSFLKNTYQVYNSVADFFVYFIELGICLLKDKGLFSIIVSNKFVKTRYGKNLRSFLLNYDFQSFIDFGDLRVFEDASTYPCILKVKKSRPSETMNNAQVKTLNFFNLFDYLKDKTKKIPISSLGENSWSFSGNESMLILEKIKKNSIPFETIVNGKFYAGIKTGLDDAFVINDSQRKQLIIEDPTSKEIIFPYLGGREVKRNRIEWKGRYIIFTKRGIDISKYPPIEKYLKKFQKKLEPRKPGSKEGRKPGSYKWYEIQDNVAYWKMYLDEGIIYTRLNKHPNFAISKPNFFPNTSGYQTHNNERWLLAILNSKVTDFFLRSICPSVRGGYFDYRSQYVSTIPISNNISQRKNLTMLENLIIKNYKELFNETEKLLNRVKEFFEICSISEKLEKFYKLNFKEFIREITKKSSNRPSLKELDEWDEYFTEKKSTILKLKNEIKKYNECIDEIVFKIYDLTSNEIKFIEKVILNKI